ncbi:MAG: mechanosensitive ion channel family protein [Firmicutes bacterium]|nr:mechanosensitive ion channel family protein [Bacillota bacterium]MBQ6259844.1 mechanosensitive ion channel family protein [Bacillota bacterium]MBR0441652.1 mechanosensitive ion channel family protein [Bacillota bacterium]
MKTNESKSGPKRSIGRAAGIAVIILMLLALCAPQLLVFLSPAQREAVSLFSETYFKGFLPLKTAEGGFDFMRIAALIFMIAACWAVYRVLSWIISRFSFKSRRAETIKGLAANLLRYCIVIFAAVFGLNILGADIITVIAGLGIMALVIGFGAQSLIEDIFAGLFILFEGRFYVGDIISIDNFRGTVKSIGIVSTHIADQGGNIRIINNSDIRVLTNLSQVPSIAVSIISIAYSADILKAEAAIDEVCARMPNQYPELFPKPPRYLGVEDLGESSVDLKIAADVQESNIYNARRTLNRELKLAMDAAGIEIPFPQVVVWQGKE